MPVMRASTHEVVQVFREALSLEREALEAYAAAIVRLGDEPLTRDTAMSFLSAHERHVEELERRLSALAATALPAGSAREAADSASAASSASGARRLLAPERFAEVSGPTPTLRLLRVNADELVRRYRQMLVRPLPEEALEPIRRICNDELRHRAWLAARLHAFGRAERRTSVPPPPPARSSAPPR